MLDQNLLHKTFYYKDGDLYWKKNDAKAGSKWQSGYVMVKVNKKPYRVHRLIFAMHNGYYPQEIDHINNNRADNRIENLRESSSLTNKYNIGIRKNNTSGIKGVCWEKTRQKWRVHVWANKTLVHCSRHENLELAELVAIEARNKYHKEFSCHV